MQKDFHAMAYTSFMGMVRILGDMVEEAAASSFCDSSPTAPGIT